MVFVLILVILLPIFACFPYIVFTCIVGFISVYCSSEDASGFFVSLLFGLGPLLGGFILVAFALAFHLQHALLMGAASGIAFVLAAWRPMQLLVYSKMGFSPSYFFLHWEQHLSMFQAPAFSKLQVAKRQQ